jgi:hypothetical protein
MPHRHGNSSKYVARQITLSTEIDDALRTICGRAGKSPSEVVRVILSRDPGIAKLLRPASNDLMAVPE